MYKKIITLFMSAVLLILSFSFDVNAQAENEQISIVTAECPQSVIEFADENVGRFVWGICQEYNKNFEAFMIGKPFKVFGHEDLELFMFPISYDGEFSYLFSVYITSEKKMIPTISDHLVEELKDVCKNLQGNETIKIIANNENLYVQYENRIEEFFVYNSTKSLDSSKLEEMEQETYNSKIFVYKTISNENINMINTVSNGYPDYCYIPLSRTETQGSEQWCAAYATAAIIRTVTGSTGITALDVATYALGANPSTSRAISHTKVINYAAIWGLNVSKVNSTLSTSSVRSRIYAGTPIYLSCRKSTDSDSRHALVLRGYSDQSASYSVWNPWYTSYYGMDMNEKIHYAVNGTQWIWDTTLYGWN